MSTLPPLPGSPDPTTPPVGATPPAGPAPAGPGGAPGYGTPAYGAPASGAPAPGYGPSGAGAPAYGVAPAASAYGMPGLPAVPASDAQPTAFIDLTVQGNRFTSNMVPPFVMVNGRPLVSEYGYRRVPVPAGPVRIDVECRWTRTFGQASMMLDLAPGQAVPVFYAAPVSVFQKGRIGHEKQSRAGTWWLLGIVGAAILLPLLFGIIAAIATS